MRDAKQDTTTRGSSSVWGEDIEKRIRSQIRRISSMGFFQKLKRIRNKIFMGREKKEIEIRWYDYFKMNTIGPGILSSVDEHKQLNDIEEHIYNNYMYKIYSPFSDQDGFEFNDDFSDPFPVLRLVENAINDKSDKVLCDNPALAIYFGTKLSYEVIHNYAKGRYCDLVFQAIMADILNQPNTQAFKVVKPGKHCIQDFSNCMLEEFKKLDDSDRLYGKTREDLIGCMMKMVARFVVYKKGIGINTLDKMKKDFWMLASVDLIEIFIEQTITNTKKLIFDEEFRLEMRALNVDAGGDTLSDLIGDESIKHFNTILQIFERLFTHMKRNFPEYEELKKLLEQQRQEKNKIGDEDFE